MKKIFTIILLFTSFFSFSQSRDKGTIELSPVIGYSQSMVFIFTSEPVGGINIGSNVDYYFNENWSFRSGLFYQTMGSKEVKFLIFSDEYSEKLKYLTIPLAINWHFGSNKNWNLNYGVSGGFLLDAKAKSEDGITIDTKDISNSFQFGINAGIGYKLTLTENIGLVFDVSQFIGFTDTNKEKSRKNFYTSFNFGGVFKL
ncbi:outer membrane beta-barrel protein [Flavobacterium solisilvae]|uniref:PorT family protein n=1 Tax=Flavobacterium solisilvae TaxID=1852019 RepID=A0ABX1R001_9FLAO|nr:outer membrane beta-barrel protein [Flavobacterium solisilvae]NMH26394.1 PorT family protein [Flavobacterium solisilvae]